MSINLLPWRENLRKRNRNRDRLCAGMAILLLILAVTIWQWHQQASLEIQRSQLITLQGKLQRLSAPYAAAVKTQAEQKKQLQLTQVLQKQRDLNKQAIHIIDNFVLAMPTNAYLKQIALKDNQLLFKGQVVSHRELIQCLRNLEQQQGMRATVVETTQAADEQDASGFLVTYEMAS